MALDRDRLVALLHHAGCVVAEEEADELLLAAGEGAGQLEVSVARRMQGEPLAWICGTAEIDGLRLGIGPGVYVPRRWQTPVVAAEASALLPPGGTAVDLCTGAGAVAALVQRSDPSARVLATEVDPVAAAWARSNGVEVFEGDLFEPLPAALRGAVDVVIAVAPYVPTGSLPLLPRDTLVHEPLGALDGGPDGLATIRRVIAAVPGWLRSGGAIVVEHGPDQAADVTALLAAAGLAPADAVLDADGDCCGTSSRWTPGKGSS